LNNIREQNWDGDYALVLRFYSPLIPLETWQEKHDKLTRFFGPGVRVELIPLAEEEIEMALITTPETAIAETVSTES
ncbi:MAG: DUF2854 domain-containing protein, partial [Cyanobacteria bacterium CAN_BIN43]|nr:DUF2854 domain-containing protein [Cyanobacteria bacterium CAN_BIN43]